MTPEYTAQLTAGLLILWLSTVIALAMLFTLAIVSYLKRIPRPGPIAEEEQEDREIIPGAPVLPTVFDRSCRWLVVKSTNLELVKKAVGLQNARPCSWGDGVSRSWDYSLFLSPPIDGWIMAVGDALPDPGEDVDGCFHLIRKLAREFGQVQFYSSDRMLNHHAWIRADHHRLKRAYAWNGSTQWNEGQYTAAEKELGLHCWDYGQEPEYDFCEAAPHAANAEKVTRLAARWSFDPSTIDAKMLATDSGLAA